MMVQTLPKPSNTEYNNVLNLTTNAENDRIYVLNQSTHTFKLEYYGNYSFGTTNTAETLTGDTASFAFSRRKWYRQY